MLDDRLFLHGGLNNFSLNDFYVLNMKSLVFTKIRDSANGFSTAMGNHTLTRVSDSEILLVGGYPGDSISNRVKIFDATKFKWKEEAPLPSEFGGSDGGLKMHKAVEMSIGNSNCVICLGGYIDKLAKAHPSHVVVFEIMT